MSEKEIWKDIKNYEGLYQISNLGRVRSLDRVDLQGRRLKGKV
ncbi:NUMOD4 domain-containing protein, partial [Lacticaseibacillus paracasei]